MTWIVLGVWVAGVVALLVRARRMRRPEPIPPVLLSLELRRIAGELARAEATHEFAKATRVNACRWAYDRALIDYCRAVDLPVMTDVVPLTAAQRLDLETELVGAGHGW